MNNNRGTQFFSRWQQKSLFALTLILACSFLSFLGIFEVHHIEEKQKEPPEVEKEEISTPMLIQDSCIIRVLLSQDGKTTFDTPVLQLEGKYRLTNRKHDSVIKENETVKLKKNVEDSKDSKDCIRLIPQEKSARIVIMDKSTGHHSYQYRGNLYIYRRDNSFFLVNELSVGEYLYGVVPSEMPSSYEMEALKAQAVCARSYVYKQMKNDSLENYYANVDDTTSYQVYRKSKESKRAIQAVDQTRDEVLFYNDEIATTYYYSTSCGRSQSYQLWGLGKTKYSYLQSAGVNEKNIKKQNDTGKLTIDCYNMVENQEIASLEKMARSYLNQPSESDLEKEYGYYRWQGKLKLKECQEELEKEILRRREADSEKILFYDKEGNSIQTMDEMGKVKRIKVIKRDAGYGIKELVIEFQKGRVSVQSEYSIRSILGACDSKITLQDGRTLCPELLPSACFYIVKQEKGVVSIRGGGFGHGLGMSQNGANEMAKRDATYQDILGFFYYGTELGTMETVTIKDGVKE